ncbi:DNA internalization-related competence protein ComEC/Rec2 [Acetonema longum]|uniref:DNA internalization-related competence protein ComEC/Rec2 n=1 Tax=Acetonema longum DSM 6540 TaxID=1009370 RepID=F7NKU9_9FIRM|nr:DNA internalization-related competence protein ComEC/Rec2 [Acetonema longum]EGO63292.1 DNA internalization-related competence protein ComEC/Rec2 [Acetonema longum DSM 6540]
MNLTILALAFILGIWLSGLYAWSLWFLGNAALLMLAVTVWQLRIAGGGRVKYYLVLLFMLVGMIRSIQAEMIPLTDIGRLVGERVYVEGIISDIPRRLPLDEQTVKIGYRVRLEQIKQNGRLRAVSGEVLVTVRQQPKEAVALPGERIAMTGKVRALHGYNNPGAVDMVAAWKRQGVKARIAPNGGVRILPGGETGAYLRTVAAIRGSVAEAMLKVMPDGDAAVIQGLLFGGYQGISQEVIKNYAATGIIHILSVSGSHIALLIGFIHWLGRRLKIREPVSAMAATVAVLSYALVAGLIPPVVRSVIMGLAALLAFAAGREKHASSALGLAALVMLVYQPGMIYDISFQLSFASTAGLVYLYPQTVQFFSRFLPGIAAAALGVTVAAQLGSLPFLAWYFSQLPASSIAANMIIVPVIEAVLILALVGSVVSLILPWLSQTLFVLASLAVGLANQMAAWLAAMPGNLWPIPPFGLYGSALYYCILGWIYGYPKGITRPWIVYRRFPRLAGAAVLLLVVAAVIYLNLPHPVRVHYIDVGQGDAALITTAHSRNILIDAGGGGEDSGFDTGEYVVMPYLRHYGVTSLEYLILTHGHADHAGGAAAIAAGIPVKNIILAREAYSPPIKALLQKSGGGRVIPAYRGQQIDLDGITIRVIDAMPNFAGQQTANESSIVIEVGYGDYNFLFTGDLDGKGEINLVTQGLIRQNTVLKAGHHGSRTSTTLSFLQQVGPEYAVISAGFQNRFGHPHKETLIRLADAGSTVLRTDLQGAVVFSVTSDGQDIGFDTYVK